MIRPIQLILISLGILCFMMGLHSIDLAINVLLIDHYSNTNLFFDSYDQTLGGKLLSYSQVYRSGITLCFLGLYFVFVSVFFHDKNNRRS